MNSQDNESRCRRCLADMRIQLKLSEVNMSVKIKVSYEHPHELVYIRRKLYRGVRKVRKQPAAGKYQRAYIDFELPKEPCIPSKKPV